MMHALLRSRRLTSAGKVMKRLAHAKSGVAMVEFALVSPIVLLCGVAGMEMANLAIVNMRLSQAAMHVADNASRIGDRDQLAAERIFEGDIEDLFIGVDIQAGGQIDIYEHGRIILSSLERNGDDGQWIHWQRCMGKKVRNSDYGTEGTGASGTSFAGMGPTGEEITAPDGGAVMFVEVYYDYQPIVGTEFAAPFLPDTEIATFAAFTVRGTRDLSQVYQRTPPATVHACNVYNDI